MTETAANRRFGYAWLGFAAALAVHVLDKATHDFLSMYNPTVQAIRARLPFLPLPRFTFGVWLSLLSAGITLLVCVSPLAFRRALDATCGLAAGHRGGSFQCQPALAQFGLLPPLDAGCVQFASAAGGRSLSAGERAQPDD